MNTEDISQILGLPQHGEAVQFVPIQLYKSDFTDRHFKGIDSCKLNHKCIHDLLIELLNGKEQTDIEDVVRLILMELFVTFLFAGSSISFALLKYCDEFDKLARYSWAEAVRGFLNRSLRTKSKLKRDGCVLLIPVSAIEFYIIIIVIVIIIVIIIIILDIFWVCHYHN
jgi:hypothetical protein